MKLIVYLIMLTVIIPFVYSGPGGGGEQAFNPCDTASFCGESYDVVCDDGADGKCPSNYGDWSDCTGNNYGDYCRPCDPDCRENGQCGEQEIFLMVPNIRYSTNDISLYANVYGYNGNNAYGIERVINGEPEGNFASENVDCDALGEGCAHTFDAFLLGDQDDACDEYIYQLNFYDSNNQFISSVLDEGMVSPFIEITNPSVDDVVQGSVNIQTSAVCNGGTIEIVTYYLCDEVEENCDAIAYFYDDQQSYSYSLDTTHEYNGNYTIYAEIIGSLSDGNGFYNIESYSTDTIAFSINNPPGSGISGRKGSKVLNLLLARLKVYL